MRPLTRGMLLGALAPVLGAAALVASEPGFWKRYWLSLGHDLDALPVELYEPAAIVRGAQEPPPPRVAPEEEGLASASLEAAADYAGSRNTHALIVSRRGHIVFQRYWEGTGFDTVADGGGFARTLAALLAGIAIGERRIASIEEPVSRRLEAWHDDPRGAITVRDLLNMTSGLEPPAASRLPWSDAVRGVLGTDLLAHELGRPLASTPGAAWADRSGDVQLLAAVIERAVGRPYAEYLSEALWKPLGAGEARMWLDRPGGMAHADCCFLARQGDWIRVGELLVNDGVYQGTEVVPPGWVRRMLTPAPGNPRYGFHVRLGSSFDPARAAEPYAADDLFLLEGPRMQRLWIVPSLKLAILRTGREPPEGAGWDDARIPNLVIRGIAAPVRAAPSRDVDPSRFVPGH